MTNKIPDWILGPRLAANFDFIALFDYAHKNSFVYRWAPGTWSEDLVEEIVHAIHIILNDTPNIPRVKLENRLQLHLNEQYNHWPFVSWIIIKLCMGRLIKLVLNYMEAN